MNNKVFIIYHDDDLINEVVNYINTNTDLQISDKFTSSPETTSGYYFCSQQDINLSIKNNSLLYVVMNDYISSGITLDDFYNNDVFLLKYNEYNSIPDILFSKHNILTVWIDSKNKNFKIQKNDPLYYELNFIEKRLETVKYEYFLNDKIEDIVNYIENFINE